MDSTAQELPKRDKALTKKQRAWAVQVGACLVKDNARRVVAELTQEGYAAHIVEQSDGSKLWHCIRIGEYAELKEAQRALSEFKEEQGKPAIITVIRSGEPVSLKKQRSQSP